MGFHENSPEYKACLLFLLTSTTQIVDLVSPAETPEKLPADLEVLSEMNVQNVEEANYEEHQENANKEEQPAEKLKKELNSVSRGLKNSCPKGT